METVKVEGRIMKPNLFVEATERGIKQLSLARRGIARFQKIDAQQNALIRRWKRVAARELEAYFIGSLQEFSTPCDLSNLPPFTRNVLRLAAKIPYGEVKSYRWIAEQLGKPKATRAVGNALARNPVPIIIPCHRVVRSDGTIGGFALGSRWKRRLLRLEKITAESSRSRGP
ncbi:MAG: methylated-DNA--[protein]-cysteine S-methyltransferase [Deltaproteobacteria bacterium]|nr:methylated-DNA--[protein]-cysteine S-methyltransferase [Deltaproteobacteria bacterium]